MSLILLLSFTGLHAGNPEVPLKWKEGGIHISLKDFLKVPEMPVLKYPFQMKYKRRPK